MRMLRASPPLALVETPTAKKASFGRPRGPPGTRQRQRAGRSRHNCSRCRYLAASNSARQTGKSQNISRLWNGWDLFGWPVLATLGAQLHFTSSEWDSQSHACPGTFLGTIGQHPTVSNSNRLHAMWSFGFSLRIWGAFCRFLSNDGWFSWSPQLHPVISPTQTEHSNFFKSTHWLLQLLYNSCFFIALDLNGF